MSTPTRAEIARANGAKSRGPVTPEGKARSAKNSLRHGLLAKSVVLECESKERFLELLQTLIDEFHPATDGEMYLVHDMACVRWRIFRCRAVDTADLNQRINEQPAHLEPPSRCAKAIREGQRNGEPVDYYRRYETSLCRLYSRHLRDLLLLQQNRPQSRLAAAEQHDASPSHPGMTFECEIPENNPQPEPQNELGETNPAAPVPLPELHPHPGEIAA